MVVVDRHTQGDAGGGGGGGEPLVVVDRQTYGHRQKLNQGVWVPPPAQGEEVHKLLEQERDRRVQEGAVWQVADMYPKVQQDVRMHFHKGELAQHTDTDRYRQQQKPQQEVWVPPPTQEKRPVWTQQKRPVRTPPATEQKRPVWTTPTQDVWAPATQEVWAPPSTHEKGPVLMPPVTQDKKPVYQQLSLDETPVEEYQYTHRKADRERPRVYRFTRYRQGRPEEQGVRQPGAKEETQTRTGLRGQGKRPQSYKRGPWTPWGRRRQGGRRPGRRWWQAQRRLAPVKGARRLDMGPKLFATGSRRLETRPRRLKTAGRRFDTIDRRFNTGARRLDTGNRRLDTGPRAGRRVDTQSQGPRGLPWYSEPWHPELEIEGPGEARRGEPHYRAIGLGQGDMNMGVRKYLSSNLSPHPLLQTMGHVGGMMAGAVAAASLGRKRRDVGEEREEELDRKVAGLESCLEEFCRKLDSLVV